MEHRAIWAPRPRAVEPPSVLSAGTQPALAIARYRARTAVEDVNRLIEAANARHRAGTWAPGGAKSASDHGLLGDAEDIVARQRTRQRW